MQHKQKTKIQRKKTKSKCPIRVICVIRDSKTKSAKTTRQKTCNTNKKQKYNAKKQKQNVLSAFICVIRVIRDSETKSA